MTRSTIKNKGDLSPSHNSKAAGWRRAFPFAVAAFWLLVWQLAYLAVSQEILIVSPLQVAKRITELASRAEFWETVAFSCGKILLGFFLAVLAGTGLAAATYRFSLLDQLFRPLLSLIKATPVASFIILALVWVRSDWLAVFISFLMVLPMVWANLCQGIASVDPKLTEMGRVFHFGPWKTLRLIYIPSVLPNFLAACTTGLGFAWKSGIAAEVLGAPARSIGRELYNAKVYLETPDLFAWTAVVVILSILLERLFLLLIRRIAGRRR